jgi:hypothetical protein
MLPLFLFVFEKKPVKVFEVSYDFVLQKYGGLSTSCHCVFIGYIFNGAY